MTFPLAFWGCRHLPALLSPDIAANLALLCLSAIITSILATRTNWNEIPLELQPACATRWGARIGLVVFLTGGGAFLLGGMASQINPATSAGGSFGASISSAGVLGIVFSVLPTIAAGSLACLSRLRSAAMEGLLIPAARSETPPNPGKRTPLTYAAVFFALCLLSVGLPSYLEIRRREARDRRAEEANRRNELLSRKEDRNTPAELPKIEQPVADEFSYAPPEGLAEVPAARLTVAATRRVPGLSGGTVAEFSRDSRFLAFVDQGDNSTTVFDVRKGKVVRKFPPLPRASGIAWSPQGDRLFYFGAGNSCLILDPASGATTSLPVRIPLYDWTPKWELQDEIEFYRGATRVANLNLTTLHVKSYQVSNAELRDSKPITTESLAETKRCSLTIRLRISALQSPLESTSGSWSFGSAAVVYATDKESGRHFPLLSPAFDSPTTFLVSPDSSTITVVSASGAYIHYLGIREGGEVGLSVAEPPHFPKIEKSSRLAELIRSGSIGAFVCAPLTNPLTGKVIGADATQVKALAVFNGGDPDHLTTAIAESYLPVQPGDVAGYLHQWQDREPLLLAGSSVDDWWSPVSVAPEPETPPASREERWQEPYLELTPCGIELKGWRDPARQKAESKTVSVALLNVRRNDTPTADPAATVGDEELSKIRTFVQSHHAKVGMRDLEGFVDDYAASTDLNDKGKVTPDFIRQDQSSYLSRYDNISETVLGDIAVGKGGGGWRVVYNLRSYALKRADNKQFDRRVSIVLDLIPSGSGRFKIVRERATVGD